MVGRPGHLERDADLRIRRVRGRTRATQSDLFLRAARGVNACPQIAPGKVAAGLGHDVSTNAIVKGVGSYEVAMQVLHAGGPPPCVTYADQTLGVRTVPGSNIDPHALDIRSLLALLRIDQVHGFAPDDTDHWPVFAHE